MFLVYIIDYYKMKMKTNSTKFRFNFSNYLQKIILLNSKRVDFIWAQSRN